MEPFLSLIIALVILGVVLYLVETFIPMAPGFKTAIRVLVVLMLCVYLLRWFGMLSGPPFVMRP